MKTAKTNTEIFEIPPLLERSRPRPVRLTAGGRILTGVALLLFAGAIVAGIGLSRLASREAWVARALVEDGVVVTGEVSRLWSNGDDRRRVGYRFFVDGRAYSGRARVSSERRRQLTVGAPIPVRYVPHQPTLNDLGGTPRGGPPVWLAIVVPAVLVLCGVLCLLGINSQRRLLAEGRATRATVTKHHSHRSSHGGSHSYVFYEFRLLSGAVFQGRSTTSSKAPAVGSTICIVYDPDRPTRSAVYPFSLVAPMA